MNSLKGSETAKSGFENEKFVVAKFNNWKEDIDAQQWLMIMEYNISEIQSVKAKILHGYKTDVNVQIKFKQAIHTENIQIKLVSIKTGFNQVDKRWLVNYQKLWNIPSDTFKILQYFTGELAPYKKFTRDARRMFLDEMSFEEQENVVNWFKQNKTLVLTDIIKGRGEFSAGWVLVINKIENSINWTLKNIDEFLQYYSEGDVVISPKGSLYIGKVTMQRKGGDGGRKTANMLQFKLKIRSL